MIQPDYFEPVMRFDQFTVEATPKNGWVVTQLSKGISWLAAEIMAGCEHNDFCQSMEHTGWLGTCPEWVEFKPVVTIPEGEFLDADHLDFMAEAILVR